MLIRGTAIMFDHRSHGADSVASPAPSLDIRFSHHTLLQKTQKTNAMTTNATVANM